MAVSPEKKRIAITLSKESIEQLYRLVALYQEDSLGQVTISNVVDHLISADLAKKAEDDEK